MAGSFSQMLLFRFLAGICSAFIGPQVWAAIPVLFAPARIGKAMGIVMAGLSVSQLAGVPLGSFLAGFDWSLPFTVVGIASLVTALFIFWKMPDLLPDSTASANPKARSILSRYRELLTLPGASRNFFAYFLFMTGVYAAFSFFGIWLSDQFSQNVTEIGVTTLFIGLGNTIGSLLSGWFLEQWGKKGVLSIGLLCTSLLYVILPHLPGLVTVQLVLFFIFLLGGMLVPVLMGHLQTLSVTSRGTISSLANACMYTGTLLGSYTAGLLYSAHGFSAVGLTTGASFLIAYVLFVRPAKKRKLIARI